MNLFDVTRGLSPYLGKFGKGKRNDGPRVANTAEVKAYLCWLAECRGVYVPTDAGFGPDGIYSKSDGGFVLRMPGYGEPVPTVTMETLGDDGEVIASQTLPIEPKKGGVIWSREDVRKAAGKVEKQGKGKAAPVVPPIAESAEVPPIVDECPQEPQERAEALTAPVIHPEPVEALSEAPAGEGEAIDPIAELLARVEALEARVEALPADMVARIAAASDGARICDTSPIAVVRPARTAAHERAIRRAWAERKERRSLASHLRIGQAQYDGMKAERDALKASHDEWEELQHRTWQQAQGHRMKRRRAAARARRMIAHYRSLSRDWQMSAAERMGHIFAQMDKRTRADQRARRMIQASRGAIRGAQGRADMAQAELARVKASMADPMQPERASDIARLIQERDAARTAAAATDARNRALQSAVDGLADRFEAMVSRVTRAEAALRAAGVTVAA